MKNIVFCADGTWDEPTSATNIYALFKGVVISANQVAFYDDGVGSDGTPLQKLAGGAFGEGLFQKIKDGYAKIAHVYDKDDQIFIFGFSRGAYTARSLAGMIAVCGLPLGTFDDKLINDAFDAYRDRTLLSAFNAEYSLYDAKIKMVGVFDTVGALGVPAIAGGVSAAQYGFLDTNLHPDVLNAYQALSIDERRQEFAPTLWTPPNPSVQGQTLQQVWFSGVHCDVGGGYPETDLSDITLSWMLGKAVGVGLQFAPDVLAEYASMEATYSLGQIHESWSPLWLFPKFRMVASNSNLGNSVAIRCQYDIDYSPQNLTLNDDVLATTYSVVPTVTAAPQ